MGQREDHPDGKVKHFIMGFPLTDDSVSLLPHPITDSIWLSRGTLMIGKGHSILQFGQQSRPAATANSDRSVGL